MWKDTFTFKVYPRSEEDPFYNSIGAMHEANPALKQIKVDTNTEEYRINKAVKITKWTTGLLVGTICLIVGYLLGVSQ